VLLTDVDAENLSRKLKNILEAYPKFVGSQKPFKLMVCFNLLTFFVLTLKPINFPS